MKKTFVLYRGERTVANYEEFVLVEAESLSMSDDFMDFRPHTDSEKATMKLISEAISKGVKNFYCPLCDPSFSVDGESIRFVFDRKPAVYKTYAWWEKKAKQTLPEYNSRLGTRLEYGAFLGVLIKKLVEEARMPAFLAWDKVCNDSRELGHFWNSEGSPHAWESTGDRIIHGYGDLANTYKILAKDEGTGRFWLASGHYIHDVNGLTIATLSHWDSLRIKHGFSVGWVVLEKGSIEK